MINLPRLDEILGMINKEEGYEVEFKESLVGLEPEDLVAFANSKLGGIILIGVKDSKDASGKQVGELAGCKVDDKGRLTILDKANSCRPPINVDISSEEIDGKDIYVINIPSGEFKPYCTNKGTYRIRGDGQKKSLYPNELLSLFIETEKEKFISSFKEVSNGLEEQIIQTRHVLVDETNRILLTFKDFEQNINKSLSDIEYSADNADSNTSSVESTVGDIEDTVNEMWKLLASIAYLLPRIDINTRRLNNLSGYEYNFAKEILGRFFKHYQGDKLPNERVSKSQKNVIKRIFPELNSVRIDEMYNSVLKSYQEEN